MPSITLSSGEVEAWRGVTRRHLTVIDERPRTRGECPESRPCPYVGCRYNLFLDVDARGALRFNFPDLDPEDMPPERSCALDVAERGGLNFEETAEALNVTREWIRQIELKAFAKLRVAPGSEQLEECHGEVVAPGRGA